jgi:esterase/lipase superfamily enzyme
VAQVSVPHSHVFGELERPFFDDNEKIGEDIVLTQLYDISNERFRTLFKEKLGNVAQDDILVFIHGYNVTFASAVRQTAQLSYDLQFKGMPLTYSWTSQGGLSTYPKDEASVMYTIPKLVAFLQEVIANKGNAKIHILAHSMGTRALANALRDISFLYDSPQFKNVILAAPDIDAEVFASNLYPYILKTSEKITIYASSHDKALDASNTLHGAKRLGEGGANISVFKDVVTIDASGVDSTFLGLGHSYFAQKELLVNDLRTLVHKSLPPQKRENLLKKLKEKLHYWQFK